MLTSACDSEAKLSTSPSSKSACRDNRGMKDSDSRGQDSALGRFLTLADVAEVLNISASQAYALVRSGELPAIKVGGHGHWRVERSILESCIDAKYEESRRRSLWQQSDYASVTENPFGLRGSS